MNKIFTCSLLFLFFSLQTYAQADQPPVNLLSGQLLDTESNPLSFATITVYDQQDSTMANGGLTDEDGRFKLELEKGTYYAIFQFIGYEEKAISNIQLQKNMDLGTIQMSESSIALDEVEVSAERSQMELKWDKRVFNVGKDLTNAGGSAADILDNVPSVTVDVEGNVSLRGSQGVRILVDGKPSGLVGMGDPDALRRLQGDIIEKIEVITNPSARYEAEGEAGIINIVLKKNKSKGLNGSFGIQAGHPSNYGASYGLNLRRKKFNLFSNFGINYRKYPGGGDSFQQFFDENGEQTAYYTTDYDQKRGGLGTNFRIGSDWMIDDKNTLTASALYRYSYNDNQSDVVFDDFDGENNLIRRTIRDNDEIEIEHNVEANLNYQRTFSKPEHKWTVDLKYINDDDTEDTDYFEYVANSNEETIQQSSNTEDEVNFIFQTDYIHPINEKTQFEAGLRAGLRTINNDFIVEEQDENGVFFPISAFDDKLKFDERVYAAYFIGETQLDKWGVQVGLRTEYSDIRAELVKSDLANIQEYLSWFPSAFLTYAFSDEDQLQISYSRRISRPRFRYLLPFSSFNNPRNNWQGNPNLQPEFTDSYELGFLKYFSKGSILSSIYYRHTDGVIERITVTLDEATTTRFPINLATRDAYGFEFNLSYDLTEKWNVNLDMNFFKQVIIGNYEGLRYGSETYTWNGRMNSRIRIFKKVDFQLSAFYRAPQITTQGKTFSIASLNSGFSMDVLKGKGTVTLSVQDIFNSRKRRSVTDLPDFYSESTFQWRRAQQVNLNFTYRLNQDKKRGRGERNFGGDGDF